MYICLNYAFINATSIGKLHAQRVAVVYSLRLV